MSQGLHPSTLNHYPARTWQAYNQWEIKIPQETKGVGHA
jgi:hypothetical protein